MRHHRPHRKHGASVLLALVALASPAFADAASAKPPVHTNAATRSNAIALEREAMDGAIAASLVGALSEQLGGRAVKIRLDHVDVETSSLRDRLVKGQGTLQIDNAQEWLGFRFSMLYDVMSESAGYPEMSIGTSGPAGRIVPNDSKLIREVEDRVIGMLGDEFGYQKVRLQLDRIETLETNTRYMRIDAGGIADFGRDGSAPAQVEGLYDRQQKIWLRVAYSLDAKPPTSSAGGTGAR